MRNFNQRFKLRDSDRHIRLLYTLFLLLDVGRVFVFIFLGPQHDQFVATGHCRSLPRVRRDFRRTDVVSRTGRGHALSPFHDAGRVYDFGPCPLSDQCQPCHESCHDLALVSAAWGLDLISPWLISYVSPVFVFTMLTGDTLMMLSFLVMMAMPLYEMWILGQPLMAGRRPGDAPSSR